MTNQQKDEDAKDVQNYEKKILSKLETLRREFKTYYGYKPCGLDEQDVQAAIDEAKNRRHHAAMKKVKEASDAVS